MTTSAGKTKFVLNASAPAFPPVKPDRRCLFLTFSYGFPLTEGQIFSYFTRMYGPYVEEVFVYKPRPVGKVAKPSLFGKIMFKFPIIPDNVMGTKERVCFVIDGIPIQCKRFVSKKTKTATTANAASSTDGHE
ncbi:hypothetical protein V5N11_000303 [Cardamine amara subsp. amara]|uniref:RRM domain-containing protein n=1 Tax=Cardamine amara subsp. amara TaxID=228776 RepID=A0ABD1BUD2_CARAN